MQPKPRADTSRLPFPNWRFCIGFPFALLQVVAGVLTGCARRSSIVLARRDRLPGCQVQLALRAATAHDRGRFSKTAATSEPFHESGSAGRILRLVGHQDVAGLYRASSDATSEAR